MKTFEGHSNHSGKNPTYVVQLYTAEKLHICCALSDGLYQFCSSMLMHTIKNKTQYVALCAHLSNTAMDEWH